MAHNAGIPPTLIDIQGVGLSNTAIQQGKKGIFSRSALSTVPELVLQEHFTPLSSEQFQLEPAIRQQVRLSSMCLFDDDHKDIQGSFDIIFCRNLLPLLVTSSRSKLINKINELLSCNGYLFLDANSGFMASHCFQPSKVKGNWLFKSVKEDKNKTSSCFDHPSQNAMTNGLAVKYTSGITIQRAETALMGGHLDQAITLFNDTLACHPAYGAQALLGKARALLNLGKYKAALKVSELALDVNSEAHSLDKSRQDVLKSLIKNLVKKNKNP